MTDNEYADLTNKIDKELKEYKDFIMTKDKKDIYESYYQIHAHEEIHDYLTNEGKKFNYKGFPKKDIIDWLYRRFMKSEYNLCYEDLGYLVDYETKKNLKKQQEL